MAESIDLEEFCQTVRQELTDLAGNNYPALKREATGMLDAVTSAENRAGYDQKYLTDDGEGKQKQVLVEWIQPIPDSETEDTEQDVCAEGVEAPTFRDVVTLTGFTSTRVMKFTESELRKYCAKPSEHMTMVIAAHMSGLFRAINKKLIAKYVAQVGGFYGGVAAGKNANLLAFDGLTEQAIPDGEVMMLEDMADLGVGRPIVVGSGIISRYGRLADIGCCNDYGQSIDELAGRYSFYRDRDFDVIADEADLFAAFSPGAIQMPTFNKYRGEFKRVVPNLYSHDTLVDPVTGLTLDWKMVYDKCDEVWRMAYFLHYDLIGLPLDIFDAADDRYGVNYTFTYKGVRVTAPL